MYHGAFNAAGRVSRFNDTVDTVIVVIIVVVVVVVDDDVASLICLLLLRPLPMALQQLLLPRT